MQIISDLKKSDDYIKNKKDFFSKNLESKSFFLLIKPNKNIYNNAVEKELVDMQIEKLIKKGFRNIEISWSNNDNWFNYVSNLKLKFPKLNLGSASIINKKSIDDSIKLGLNYSMMKEWDKDLLNYSRSKNHLLIPGIKNLKDLGDYERNAEDWKLINIRCGNPFYCVGFLAAISSQTALNGLDITMTSTYTNDYIMCKEEELEKCANLLISLGFSKKTVRD